MKKFIGIIALISIVIAYFFFLFEQSEFIAGEVRCYTLYEKYKAKEKYFDFEAKSYNLDIYNIKRVKNVISDETETLDKFRQKMNLFNDSINLNKNTTADYNRYITSLKELKIEVENQRNVIKNYENDLNELYSFINKIERDLFSIKMYKSEIDQINKHIKYVDSATNKYSLKIDISTLIAATRGIELNKKLQKENEIILAQIEKDRERERENQQSESNSTYNSEFYDPVNKSINYAQKLISEQRRNELLNKTYTIPQIQQSPNGIIHIPDNNYNYSTNTNSDVEQVGGYIKANGTYVEPYIRTVRNSTEIDNFSHYGNYDPYTGNIGRKK